MIDQPDPKPNEEIIDEDLKRWLNYWGSCYPVGRIIDAIRAARKRIAELERRLAETQRLRDLVRHQRGELHEAGLISDEEYTALVSERRAVARLESYDAMRQQSQRDRERIEELENRLRCIAATAWGPDETSNAALAKEPSDA